MINVIKINLNQASSKAARLEKRREQTRWGAFAFVVLILISGFAYLVFENSQFAQIIDETIDEFNEACKRMSAQKF